MMLLLAALLATLGFAALALAMDRGHQKFRAGVPGSTRRAVLRMLGSGLLAASLLFCVQRAGWGVGAVEWFGLLTAGAIVVVLMLAFLPARAAPAPSRRDARGQPAGTGHPRGRR